MTVYTALWAGQEWETTPHPEPPYQEVIFTGAGGVPILAGLLFQKILKARLLALMELQVL